MSFYTSPAGKFKFQNLPDNKPNSKKAFVTGFIRAIAEAPLSATEKLAWVKYAGNVPPPPGPGGPDNGGGDIDPVAGPGPGFVPEGAGEEQAVQQLLDALPGNSMEEKLHAAAVALLQAQQEGAGDDSGVGDPGAGVGDGGVEDDGTGIESGDGQLDPALIQQLMSQQGPPPQGGPQPPPGAPPKGPQG